MQDRQLISRLFPDKFLKIKKAGGQTNRNFVVNVSGHTFFVRLPWKHDIINRAIEGENIMRLSRNKKLKFILPEYYSYILKKKNILNPKSKEVFDVPDGTMVTQYIKGRQLTGTLIKKREIQEALARTLHTFYTSNVKFVNRYDVFRDEIAKYRLAAKKYLVQKLVAPQALPRIVKIEVAVKEYFPFLERGIATHNDLIFENFLVGQDGNVYLVDFEYGGFNVRGGMQYDLGILLGGNLFYKTPMTIEIFEKILAKIASLFSREFNKEQIYYGALINILVMFWWGVVRYFSVKIKREKTYFKNYVQKRARGIFKLYAFLKKEPGAKSP